MSNSIVLAATGFFFWMVAARFYSTEAVGFSSAAISAVGLLALLSTLGFDYGLIRFVPLSGDKARDIINSCLTISGAVSIVLTFIFLAGLSIWSPELLPIRKHPVFFIAFIVFTTTTVLMTLLKQIFIAKKKTEFALLNGLFFGLFRFVPLMFLAAPFLIFGIFAAWGIALLMAVLAGILLLLPRTQSNYFPFPTVKKNVVNDIVHFSSLNYIANLLWVAPTLIFPLMVLNLLGAKSSAYFYIGWSISNLLHAIPVAASFSLLAEGYHNETQLKYDTKRTLNLILLILIPAILLVFFAGGKILLLFGQAYSENAKRLLWVLALSALPVSLNLLYFSTERVKKRMKSVMLLSALVAFISLSLSYFLLLHIGLLGVGIGWTGGQGLVALMVLILSKLRR